MTNPTHCARCNKEITGKYHVDTCGRVICERCLPAELQDRGMVVGGDTAYPVPLQSLPPEIPIRVPYFKFPSEFVKNQKYLQLPCWTWRRGDRVTSQITKPSRWQRFFMWARGWKLVRNGDAP